MKENQNDMLIDYLEKYGSITAMDALNELGIMRLAARVHDLRERGWFIETKTCKTHKGKRYAQYILHDPLIKYEVEYIESILADLAYDREDGLR